jgi:hypothetical protein
LIYDDAVISRATRLALPLLLLAACATLDPPVEQRTTQGPTARELWAYRMTRQLGREPNFDERRHHDEEMEQRIGQYLREHPEDANALSVSTFRFLRQAAVGMNREQITILLGPPLRRTADAAEIEALARKFWDDVKDSTSEAWAYPLGWTLYFDGDRVVDITQFLKRSRGDSR